MAYELDLLVESKVHNVFHVSCLKKVLGNHLVPSTLLPLLDDEGELTLVPKAIIDFRERNLRQRTIKEYLVKWKNLTVEYAISRSKDCNVPFFLAS